MKKERLDEAMKQHFQRIRGSLADMRVEILKQIASAAQADAQNAKKYNADYLMEKRLDMRNVYNERIEKIKNQAKQAVNVEVAAINMLLTEWISEPAPERLTTLLHLYQDFHLEPSRAEVQLMREAAEGSYIGQKLINGFSDQFGIHIPCVSVEAMTKAVREMAADAEIATAAYAGTLGANYKYLADDMGLSISPDELKTFRPFAENYGREPVTVEDGQIDINDSLARAESLFTEAMRTPDLKLTDSKRNEFDKLFSSCQNDADRLEVAATIMQTGGLVADLMPMYDGELTKQALKKTAEDKRRSATKSMQKFEAAKEEAAKATQAATSADMAARQAAGDYSL